MERVSRMKKVRFLVDLQFECAPQQHAHLLTGMDDDAVRTAPRGDVVDVRLEHAVLLIGHQSLQDDAGAVAQIVSVKEGTMPSARDHGFMGVTREKGSDVHGQSFRKPAQKLQRRIDTHLLDLREHAFRTADSVGKFFKRQFTKLTPAPQGVTDRLM